MRRFFTKKRSFVALAAVAVLAIAGAAFAYFTDSGSGTGSATVGTSTPWGVAVNSSGATFSDGLSAIYPGVGTEAIPYTVTNNGNGHQNLASITLVVAKDSTGDSNSNPNFGDAQSYNSTTKAYTDIPGCLASWFNISEDSANPSGPGATTPAAVDLGPGASYSGSVDLTMSDAPTTQDSCKSKSPAVIVSAN